ncbi:MAG: copper resistance system multicopper oxidase [Acidobacteriota bacterium]|nr:copper resistance system multicopper oxidase [Acidobacteriota bacterium]
MIDEKFDRRTFIRGAGTAGILFGLSKLMPNYVYAGVEKFAKADSSELSGKVINLQIGETVFKIGTETGKAVTVNGTLPAPLIRLKEGEDITLNVTNTMHEDTSIHWHGILLPFQMDGVPGLSFAGIKPGETFKYQFPVKQSGTYWYHSHTGMQEQLGLYGPIIIDPIEPEPFEYDRDYVVVLSDWTFDDPMKVASKLKKMSSYYNYQKPTVKTLMKDAKKMGFSKALSERLMWERMRMDQTDFADVTGVTYTYLMNGLSPDANWSGVFNPGEKVRLRFINSSAMTIFDVRIPGLKMTVVAVDGQNVQPVPIEEFRIAVAETYDVIVEPEGDKAYTVFAESLDRSGFARGTLAPRQGMIAPIPERRSIPKRTMKDMGMDMSKMKGMDMDGMDMDGGSMDGMKMDGMNDGKMDHSKMDHSKMDMPDMKMDSSMKDMKMSDMNMNGNYRTTSPIPGSKPMMHKKDHGPGNSMNPMITQSRLHEPGDGLGNDGRRVLVYTDLKSVKPFPQIKEPRREMEIHVTGNMERYMWSFDGKKFSEVKDPIQFKYGETLRVTFVNDTMMEHPLHLHGMWMYLENGHGDFLPRKHTINVKPAERVSVIIFADAPGRWAFHCHLLMHMEMGMFRIVEVTDKIKGDA